MTSFVHVNTGNNEFLNGTICLSVPSKPILLSLITECKSELMLYVGCAFLHPKDQFVKSVGREIASNNFNLVTSVLKKVEPRSYGEMKATVWHFEALVDGPKKFKSEPVKVCFGISMCNKSDITNLEYGFFE